MSTAHESVSPLQVGRSLRRATAGTGKKLSLQLGGKLPFIVFDSADLDSAVDGLVDAIWLSHGQVCLHGNGWNEE